MKIVDVWERNANVFAYCIGDGIDASFACKEISVDNKRYAVEDFEILTSLNGALAAVLKIGVKAGRDLPQGAFKIVS